MGLKRLRSIYDCQKLIKSQYEIGLPFYGFLRSLYFPRKTVVKIPTCSLYELEHVCTLGLCRCEQHDHVPRKINVVQWEASRRATALVAEAAAFLDEARHSQ